MERKVEREEKTKGKREKTVVRDRQFPNMKEEERQAPHMQLQPFTQSVECSDLYK